MAATTKPLPTAAHRIDLRIGGMTCASCASRIANSLRLRRFRPV